MEKRQQIYIKEDFIDVIYCLVDAYKVNKEVPLKENIQMLRPIDEAYSGYYSNKVQFEDFRIGKIYEDEWERNENDIEEDRLNVIRKMNRKIEDYNHFVKNHEKDLGLDNIDQWKYYPCNEFPEWSLSLYLSKPTLRETDDAISHRLINNQWFYKKATRLPQSEFKDSIKLSTTGL